MLLAVFEDPATDEDTLSEVRRTLGCTADPRAMDRVAAIALDASVPNAVRERAASLAISEAWISPSREQVRDWWHSGDPVAARIALAQMDADDEEMVVPVALDSGHPLHVAALDTMRFGFDAPRFQSVKAAGFASPVDEAVEIAASLALYDEPAWAEPQLIAATCSPCAAVANEALQALEYYPTRRVLRYLTDLQRDASARERLDSDQLAQAIAYNLGRFGDALRDHPTLTEWMKPVADLVTPSEPEDPITPRTELPPPPIEPEQLRPLVESLAIPDGPWSRRLGHIACRDWSAVSRSDRDYATTRMIGHPDREVRRRLCTLLRVWNDASSLLTLARDCDGWVWQTAVYELSNLEPALGIAGELAAILDDPTNYGRRDVLQAWAEHAPADEVVERMRVVAADSAERVYLRSTAILTLLERHKCGCPDCRDFDGKIPDVVRGLLPTLDEPPAVDWSVHVALLQACRHCGVDPRPFGQWLGGVDNLDVRVAWESVLRHRDGRPVF